jgi:hypothetical protein
MVSYFIMCLLMSFVSIATHVMVQMYFEGHEAFNDPVETSPGLRHYEALKVPVY